MTEQDAKNELLAQRMGAEVVVVAGRKIPLGVRGILRWSGQGNFGPSVGISVPGEPKLLYTSPNNLSVVFPGLSPGEEPEGGWLLLWEEVQKNIRTPKKGDTVRADTEEGSVIGEVFWVRGIRFGLKPSGGGEGIFVDIEKLESLTPEGAWKPCITPVRAVPAGKAPAPAGSQDLSLEDDDSSTPAPASSSPKKEILTLHSPLSFPPPFCDIRKFVPKDGVYSALDQNGEEICILPEETVMEIFSKSSQSSDDVMLTPDLEDLGFEDLDF